jgi:hypothetical protein
MQVNLEKYKKTLRAVSCLHTRFVAISTPNKMLLWKQTAITLLTVTEHCWNHTWRSLTHNWETNCWKIDRGKSVQKLGSPGPTKLMHFLEWYRKMSLGVARRADRGTYRLTGPAVVRAAPLHRKKSRSFTLLDTKRYQGKHCNFYPQQRQHKQIFMYIYCYVHLHITHNAHNMLIQPLHCMYFYIYIHLF